MTWTAPFLSKSRQRVVPRKKPAKRLTLFDFITAWWSYIHLCWRTLFSLLFTPVCHFTLPFSLYLLTLWRGPTLRFGTVSQTSSTSRSTQWCININNVIYHIIYHRVHLLLHKTDCESRTSTCNRVFFHIASKQVMVQFLTIHRHEPKTAWCKLFPPQL